jgi:hypothetical protein
MAVPLVIPTQCVKMIAYTRMPRTWLAGLLSKLRDGVSRTRKALKMSGGAKKVTKSTVKKPAAAKPAAKGAKPAAKGTPAAKGAKAAAAPAAVKVGAMVTCKGMLGSSKPFKVSKIAPDAKKVQQVYDAAKPAKPAYPLAKCTVAPAAAPVVPIKAGATVTCKGMFGTSKPFVVASVKADKKGVRQVFDKAKPTVAAYPEAKCTVGAAAAPVVPIKAGATVTCKGMLGSSKPFVVAKVEADKKGVRQVFDKAKPTVAAYPEAKCTVAAAVAPAKPITPGATVICKGMLGSSKPFVVGSVKADKKGVRQVFDAAKPTVAAYPEAKCAVAPSKFKKGDMVQCTTATGGRTTPLSVTDPDKFVLTDPKTRKVFKTYKPATCAVAGNIRPGATVKCKGMLGSSKPFVVGSIKIDAKGVSQVYDKANPKTVYAEAKCTKVDPLPKAVAIKAGSSVTCKGMFGTSKPFTVAKVEADKKGVRQVFDEAKPTKAAYPEAKCTVVPGSESAGTDDSVTDPTTGNAGTGNAGTGNNATDPTVSPTVTAIPVSVGEVISAPPPTAPPPPAGNTIALKLPMASEQDVTSNKFNAAFFKATGQHVNAVYRKKPDGTVKVLNAPAAAPAAGGGRTRKMRGGAPKAPKAPKAAKPVKPLTAEQQAKKNAGIAASKTKKASAPPKQAKMTPQQKAAQKAAQKGMTPQQKMNAQKAAQAQARAAKPAKPPKLSKNAKRQAALNKTRSNIAAGKGPTTITRNNANTNAAYAQLSGKKEAKSITIETKGPIDPKAVEKPLEAELKKIGLPANVSPVAPPDPTPDTPADANASKGTTFAAANHKDGDTPFDFASLAANPGKPIELKGKQLDSRFQGLGRGQILHKISDAQSGVEYSEFAVEDPDAGGLRTYRVVGTPSQIAAGSKTIANRIQLEEIMLGPGGYVTLLRDLQDEQARKDGDIKFFQDKVATYKASIEKLDPKQRKALGVTIPRLESALKVRTNEMSGLKRDIMSFQAARNAAASMGAPLTAAAAAGGGKRKNTRRCR